MQEYGYYWTSNVHFSYEGISSNEIVEIVEKIKDPFSLSLNFRAETSSFGMVIVHTQARYPDDIDTVMDIIYTALYFHKHGNK